MCYMNTKIGHIARWQSRLGSFPPSPSPEPINDSSSDDGDDEDENASSSEY